jgi:hypothetical protein
VSASSFPAFFAQMRSEPVYVILGVQGSGTNLLRSILDPTFNFSVVQDQALVYNAARRLGQTPSTASVRREFDAMLPRLVPTARGRKTLRRIKTNGSFEGIEAHFDAQAITSGTDLAYFVYAYSAYSRNSSLMAIKSDDIWETIEHIDSVLPKRRIILLTRDFRDNLLSITNKDFGPIHPLVAAHYVKKRFAYYDAEFRRTSEEHRIHVRYEDLLEDPNAFVMKLREHFGLGFNGDTAPQVNTGRIRRGNTRKWAALSPRQLAHCEAVLANELSSYGYATERLTQSEPGALAWRLAAVSDTLQRVPQKLKKLARRLGR